MKPLYCLPFRRSSRGTKLALRNTAFPRINLMQIRIKVGGHPVIPQNPVKCHLVQDISGFMELGAPELGTDFK